MAQLLLFPDPRPLEERLGVEFFRTLPECPGVYLMYDAQGTVLYVGKARNLRQRLGHYRVANPDRMPRRHLRLLRAVARIELQECPDEAAALARESALLRELKPRFNRAGTWPSPTWYLAWRRNGRQLELAVVEQPDAGWAAYGPRGRRHVSRLRSALGSLLWCLRRPEASLAGLPVGWVHGVFKDHTIIPLSSETDGMPVALENVFCGNVESILDAFQRGAGALRPFELAARRAALETLAECLGLELEADAAAPLHRLTAFMLHSGYRAP